MGLYNKTCTHHRMPCLSSTTKNIIFGLQKKNHDHMIPAQRDRERQRERQRETEKDRETQ